MTYYGGKQLAEAFRTVRQNTIQTAQDIPEDRFDFAAGDGAMTVGAMLAHLVASTNFHHRVHGLDRKSHLSFEDFAAYMGQAKDIETSLTGKPAIIEALTARGEQFAAWLETLTEDELTEAVTFPAGLQPPSKTRFEMLLGAKEHEMHHRAQLMVVQRLLGITPHLTRRRREAQAARAAAAGTAAAPSR
ncbi:MAG: DinB family protein [Vicinamibacterales bacterium]